MKKFIAFTLMLVLILACLAPAIAATAELTAMSHGGTAQTGYVKKTKTGDPSVTINSLTGLQDTLLLNFRIRYSNALPQHRIILFLVQVPVLFIT